MSRTPYSPFVLKATAPEPWKVGRRAAAIGVAATGAGSLGGGVAIGVPIPVLVSGRSSIPSEFVGISVGGTPPERQRR